MLRAGFLRVRARLRFVLASALLSATLATSVLARVEQPELPAGECFLLLDEQSGQAVREPSDVCATRVTPASSFKIPHALAALDAGVVSGPHDVFRYDGAPLSNERWTRDHDLASAMRDSVVWYFQRIATRLGVDRERAYLKAFGYGNQDVSGPLTGFWIGSSLRISPDEQLQFLRRFFAEKLPVRSEAVRIVREILVQPQGRIVNALGEHPMASPWPDGTIVRAKTGSAGDRGRAVTWLVGRVERGGRSWLFVSCVIGGAEPLAAVNLAAARLKQLAVL